MADHEDESVYHEPIWLRGLRDPSEILEGALETNRVVENCEVNIDDDFLQIPDDAHHFMTNISRLNGLKSIRLLPDKFNKIYAFPIDLLTTALMDTSGLQMFSLCALDLYGRDDSFDLFLTTLRHHTSLSLIRFIRCRIPETTSLLDQLVASLSEVQSLREVELSAAENSALGSISVVSWTLLHRYPSLEKIRLDNFELNEQRILESFQALEHNNRLKGVCISSCDLSSDGFSAMAQMLRTNETLEELSLCLTHNKDNEFNDESLITIAQSLEENTSLQQFRLSGWPKCREAVQKSFVQMLRRNYALEALSLFDRTYEYVQREIDFFLALNRLGRKRMMDENATRQDWLTVIANSQVDLNCLYFFLSLKPELLDGSM